MLKILRAKYMKQYIIWVSLSDGSKGLADLSKFVEQSNNLKNRSSKNISYFANFILDAKTGNIRWGEGEEIFPEFLKNCISSTF